MVKQWIGEVHSLTPWGAPADFRVFATGDDRWVLFDPLDRDGASLCQQFPVRRADLRQPLRSALRRGCDFTTAARNQWEAVHA